MKKWLSLTLAMVLCMTIIAPASAAYTLDAGKSAWSTSNAPIGTETVNLQELVVGRIEMWEGEVTIVESTYTYHEHTAYTFPIGTVITLESPSYAYTLSHEIVYFEGIDFTKYDNQGYPVEQYSCLAANFSLTITDSNTVYCLSSSPNTNSNGVESAFYPEYIYVKGVKTSDSPTVGGFTDVKTGDYFADAVLWAVENNITKGTSATTFSPNVNCNKAQILTFLWRSNGSPEPTAINTFTDITTSDYYYKAALWAAEKGLVSGNTFGANTDCTRSMVVTYLWKLAGSPTPSSKANFLDVYDNADYAQAVSWAVENKITSGTSTTTFSPNDTCTRGQIVTFLHRTKG